MTQPRHPLEEAPRQQRHPLELTPDDAELNENGESQPEKSRGIPIVLPNVAETLPRLTQILVVINLVIFLPRYIIGDYFEQSFVFGAIFPEMILQYGEVYRLFTAMFLHFNEMHILFNSLALYSIGRNVERLFGHTRFLLIYLLGAWQVRC